uniref:Uncharacterized protein n=1 Tax=Haemonchus placei TaxID=6290 RepID=A0A0N4VX64_HAEPC
LNQRCTFWAGSRLLSVTLGQPFTIRSCQSINGIGSHPRAGDPIGHAQS